MSRERAEPQIRLAAEDDLGRVCEIVNHFIDTSAVNFRTAPQHVEDWRHDWARLRHDFPWLVATYQGEVVGVAYAAPWNSRGAYRWTVESTIYVDAASHGRGVGDALYVELLERLRDQGFRNVIAMIALPNPPSVGLHRRHGFVPAGELPDLGFKHGSWHSIGLWHRVLRGDLAELPPPRPVCET